MVGMRFAQRASAKATRTAFISLARGEFEAFEPIEIARESIHELGESLYHALGGDTSDVSQPSADTKVQ